MWFLHIFGDNIEDYIGHFRYLFFYLAAGIVSVGAQYVINTESAIVMIGASGAVSGVVGAYFVLFRNSRIEAIVPTFFGVFQMVELPAWFFLGYWFIIQVFSGLGSLTTMDINMGGIAFFAHIGGFIYGFITARSIKQKTLFT